MDSTRIAWGTEKYTRLMRDVVMSVASCLLRSGWSVWERVGATEAAVEIALPRCGCGHNENGSGDHAATLWCNENGGGKLITPPRAGCCGAKTGGLRSCPSFVTV